MKWIINKPTHRSADTRW